MELADISFEVDALDEWKKICNELGMEKQTSLTKGKDSPIPYPFMNTTMNNVYNTLCPYKVEYKEYDKTPVPLPVLKQIQFSVKEKHFSEIQIWYDDKTPCPVVVGIFKKYWRYHNKGYERMFFDTKELAKKYNGEIELNEDINSDDTEYLIATWGDELKEFNELKELAKIRLIEQIGNDLSRTIKESTEKLNLIKENVASYLNGDISLYSIK